MPSISSCWPMTSEVDVGGIVIETEPFHQHSITFCCCVTDGSTGAVWQNGIWHESAYEAKGWNCIPACRKNCTYWHSLTLAQCLWRPNSGCEPKEWCISAVVTMGHLCWCRFYKRSMQALVHCWKKYTANDGDYVEKQCFVAENLLYQIAVFCSFHGNK